MVTDPWSFGWTQLLASFGLFLTAVIAGFGFRSFERWRIEKLEEQRIAIAIDALSLAYEAKYVFQAIRSPASQSFESKDMPRWQGETVEQNHAREPYFAILARIERNKDFFERLFKLQSKFMALFGSDKEDVFMKCHIARRSIEVSASMLMNATRHDGEWSENGQRQRNQWECDIWEGMEDVFDELPGARRVTEGIRGFREGIVAICQPVAERKKATGARSGLPWIA